MGGLAKTLSKVQKIASPLTGKLDKKLEKAVYGKDWDKDPEAPELPKVLEMPDEDAITRSRKRTDSRRRAGSGRSSTILSDGLGG